MFHFDKVYVGQAIFMKQSVSGYPGQAIL